MRYLLDVSVLLALGVLDHEFNHRVGSWLRPIRSSGIPQLATCPITELGFVRIVARTARYGFTVSEARELLSGLKQDRRFAFTFISDDHDISRLPSWVKHAKQTTDGHLLELAKANDAVLATLDVGIPGAFLIPDR